MLVFLIQKQDRKTIPHDHIYNSKLWGPRKNNYMSHNISIMINGMRSILYYHIIYCIPIIDLRCINNTIM